MSKIQILWVAPGFLAFHPGAVLTSKNLEAAGYSVDHLLDSNEAQVLDDDAEVTLVLPEPDLGEPEFVQLARLKKAELLELAAKLGLVSIDASQTKTQIIDAIEAAKEAAQQL